ncbi:MAG: hypothetical protein F4234_14630 [Gammaproteobacteria bacterium]|nr:NotI family restriction endonuclease [Gammaproteobacteria bacterium]MDE0478592.1 NotI family restriction endonuclease [Gammaproteobacteria bacterium]MXX06713.1 hypothetical protein [Gammaproteobacteria bacterium]MXY89904.1 hypothetical protein [Gammaproteobacteria bacterium]MYA35595.1 hypothetical protein [Gammaproteobacteria bacterium]
MPYRPDSYIAEVLGRPALESFDPGAEEFYCPFVGGACTKRSTSLSEPYPVCSIYKRDMQICVCPKRFQQVNFLKDVVRHCWPGEKPSRIKAVREVKMKGFGNVDFVIADMLENGEVDQFLSVELQAIDITGTVMDAYKAWRAGTELKSKKSYGLNWSNVYKRYITQLIRKGYFHHHWGTKIVAVMQDAVYEYIKEWADFMRSSDVKEDKNINIVFMSYKFEEDPNAPGSQRFVLSEVEGTSHANLQQAVLYKDAPSRDQFCGHILKAMNRTK